MTFLATLWSLQPAQESPEEGSAPEPVPVSASPYCRCQSPCYPCLVHLNQSLCQPSIPVASASIPVTPVPEFFLRMGWDFYCCTGPWPICFHVSSLLELLRPCSPLALSVLCKMHRPVQEEWGTKSEPFLLRRTETVRLPDGLCNNLSAIWTKDPNFKVTKEIATQTDFVPVSAGQHTC